MATKCAVCKKEVDEKNGRMEANGRKYHIECFKCETCSKSLANSLYTEDIGVIEQESPDMIVPLRIEHARLFCIECTKKAQQKSCDGCKKPFAITDTIIRVIGQRWHPNCFVCAGCGSIIKLEYFARNGKQFCSKITCGGSALISFPP